MNTVVAQPSMVLGRFRKKEFVSSCGCLASIASAEFTLSRWDGQEESLVCLETFLVGMIGTNFDRPQNGSQDNLPGTTSSFRSVVIAGQLMSQSLCLWLLYLTPCLPSPLQKRGLSLEDGTESWFCAEWASDSNPWAVFTVTYPAILGVFLWFHLCELVISWLSRICYKESIACAHSELFSNPVGIPNYKSAARAEFPPKVREGERIFMIPPPAAVISAFILNMLTVWWWCVEPFI